jgi:hypothetical protein
MKASEKISLSLFYPNKCETEQTDLKAVGHVTFNTFTSVIAVQPAGSTSWLSSQAYAFVSRDFYPLLRTVVTAVYV